MGHLYKLTSIHFRVEELDGRVGNTLTLCFGQTVPLVMGFRCINWIDLNVCVTFDPYSA